MSFLYAVVARGTTVLAHYTHSPGNYSEVAQQILPRITPENAKMTYTHENYLFHFISEDRVIYLCITNDEFERSRAFGFLNDAKRRFQGQYGQRVHTALPYSMNSEFSKILSSLAKFYTSSNWTQGVAGVQSQVDELTDILVRNVDQLTVRGESLHLLVDKAERMEAGSVQFRAVSRQVQRHFLLKNIKMVIVGIVAFLLVFYLLVSACCGGFTWPCTRRPK